MNILEFQNSALQGVVSRATSDPFITTWLTTNPDETLTLPLRSGFNYNMLVDWGDSSSSTITAWDQAEKIHTFATPGTQTITITGLCEAWYFNRGGDRRKIRTVENWGDVGFTGEGLVAAFYGCSSATSFGSIMPAYAVTSLSQTWEQCASCTTFPNISSLTLVDCLYSTWKSRGACATFPDISALTLVTTVDYAWYFSTATSFPDVSVLPLLSSIQFAWDGCASMTTVTVLPSESTALTKTWGAFNDIGSGMGGTVSELWNTEKFPNISTYIHTFTGCTGLDNYADIPDGWKGL